MSKTIKKSSLKGKVSVVKPSEKSDEESDVDIQFDDEEVGENVEDSGDLSSASENEDLDQVMLATRHESLNETADDSVEKAPKKALPIKKMVGSKAKLRALMHHVDPEEEVPAAEPTEEKTKKVTRVKKTTKVTAKKGPGRPRKTPKKEPIPRKGISKTPQDSGSSIELLYDQPIIMKKIFQFFKSVAAAQIQIIFRPRDIIFYAMDHHEKSKIRVRIDATKLNHYFCRDVLDIGVTTKEMELILNKVDKEYSSIIVLSNTGSTQRTVTVVLENDIEVVMHQVEIIGQYNKMEDEESFIDENYMIQFEFPSKHFKKTINDIKTMSPQVSITQEDNDSPIKFEYLTENKRIQSKHTVKEGKIKLVSNLPDDKSFRVDVRIDYIKPISSAQIADEIMILVDENKSFMTKAYIDDGTVEIKTLTEIIDERPEEEE